MIAQVTTGFTAAGPLLLPGHAMKMGVLQNNGTADWRLSLDGSATGLTTTAGFLLKAGQQLFLNQAQFPSYGPKTVYGIFVGGGGTQLLDIVTDDKDSTAPAHT